MYGNPHTVLDDGYLAHLATAETWLAERGATVNPIYTTLLGVAEHGPQLIVTHGVFLGDTPVAAREVDHVVVVGIYVPHDGNVTTVINHVDGLKVLDSAEELFGDG